MFRRIDESRFLLKMLERISNYFAQRRGLLIVVGTIMLALGFVLEFLNVFLGLQWVEALEVFLRNIGIISALVGIMISEPLGS
jgi:hypothetical protein